VLPSARPPFLPKSWRRLLGAAASRAVAPIFFKRIPIKERARGVVTNPALTLVDIEAPAQLLITK
jgi:hypothetical protein